MPLVHRRPPSTRLVASNRLNARKSTGPRTLSGKRRAALNSLRHGLRCASDSAFHSAMERLGENPAAFDRLLESLRTVWQPEDPLQELLTGDLARLYWLKIRAEQAGQLFIAQRVVTSELEREQAFEDLAGLTSPFEDWEVPSVGYRRAHDCPEKYQECLRILERLMAHVEARDWSSEIKNLLGLLYTGMPLAKGGRIMLLFARFLPEPSQAGTEDDYQELRTLLAWEKEQVLKEKEIFECAQRESKRAERALAMVKLQQGDEHVEAGEASFDRRIGEKIRLLVMLKRLTAARSRVAGRRARNRAQSDAPTKFPGPAPAKKLSTDNERSRQVS